MAQSQTAAPENVTAVNTGNQAPPLLALVCLLLVGSLLGLSFVVAKLAITADAAPISFLFASMAGAGSIIMGAELIKTRHLSASSQIIEYGLCAGALFAIPNALAFTAVEHVGAGFLSLTFAFPILITYVLTLVLKMDRFQIFKAVAVGLGLSGGVVLAVSKANSGDAPIVWIILVMLSPVIIAVGNIYRTLRWPAGASSLFLAGLLMIFGGLLILPMALLIEPGGLIDIVVKPTTRTLLFIQIALFSVLYVFYFILQRIAGPVYLSQIGFVAAVVGTTVAVGLLSEQAPRNLTLAAVLITTGTMIFHWGGRRKDGAHD